MDPGNDRKKSNRSNKEAGCSDKLVGPRENESGPEIFEKSFRVNIKRHWRKDKK